MYIRRFNISRYKNFKKILGIKINIVDKKSTIEMINENISHSINGKYICACPVHPIIVSQRDKKLREALNNSWLTLPDGMPVVWAVRLFGGKINKNIRGTDLMISSCALAEKKGYSVYFYGSKPETLRNLVSNLIRKFPKLKIAGYYSPPFRELTFEEEKIIIKKIDFSYADILFIGLGAPKQEKWMHRNCIRLKIPVTIGVGAAFDFISGEKSESPSWMQNMGIEWFYRFLNEPKRLFIRYMLYNPIFIIGFFVQFFLSKFKILKNKASFHL